MADKYQANIAGFDLDCQTISDGFQKAIVRHEFANTNGALLEDQGQKARVITIRCFFYNDTFADYGDFIAALDDSSVVEFVHPEEGLLKGGIERVDKRKDDRLLLAEVDVTFVLGRIEENPSAQASVDGDVENAFLDGQTEAEDEFGADMPQGLIDKTLDAGKGILEQFSDLTGSARHFVAQVDGAVRTLEGTLVSVQQPFNSIIATVDYAANLPGRVVGAVAATVERMAESYQALRAFPQRFAQNLRAAEDQLAASFDAFRTTAPAGSARAISETAAMAAMAKQVRIASALRLSLEASQAFKTDQLSRQAALASEGQKSFDSRGNFLNPPTSDPFMNIREIEATLAEAMTAAQAVLDRTRNIPSIKTGTAALVDHVVKIKLNIEKIYTVEVIGTIPVHLLCLKYGLPYNAADRILAINPQIKHPNFISGKVNIYAR